MPQHNQNKFLKYSGLAFQLVAYILVGYFVGHYIDQKMQNDQPLATALCSSIFVLIGLFFIMRDILRIK